LTGIASVNVDSRLSTQLRLDLTLIIQAFVWFTIIALGSAAHPASIHDQCLAVNIARGFAGQKHDRAAQIIR
jgi:hypothetical protein